MAQFTYEDIKKEKVVDTEDEVILYGEKHIVKHNDQGYYLKQRLKNKNDWIFQHLGIKDKYSFCDEDESNNGIFPYKRTAKELTQVIKKLWDYIPLKIGDKVLVRNIHASSYDDYGVGVTDTMAEMSNTYISVDSIYREDIGSDTDKHGVYTEIKHYGFWFSSDLLDFTHIIRSETSLDYDRGMLIEHPYTPDECFKSTGLILPRKNKNIKIKL